MKAKKISLKKKKKNICKMSLKDVKNKEMK